MGLRDVIHDTRQQEDIFPISSNEAAALHDMGWSSGYGWRNQWDWWKSDMDEERAMDSRNWDCTKRDFYAALVAIRTARNAADEIVRQHFLTPKGNRTLTESANHGAHQGQRR